VGEDLFCVAKNMLRHEPCPDMMGILESVRDVTTESMLRDIEKKIHASPT
jgi:hypothetical protein